MLNARLYRTSWLVVAVALIVALLTLQSRTDPPEPGVPYAIDGGVVRDAAADLERVAPLRIAGSQDDRDAADWMAQQFTTVSTATGTGTGVRRVGEQEFVARQGSDLVTLRNVYLAVPGTGGAAGRGGIVVVAPRDVLPGVRSGATSSALLVEMARMSATTTHDRPLLFVSTSGSTVGNAGMRWFLTRFSDFRIAAVVVLDAAADGEGDRLWLWGSGRDGRQALDLEHVARVALRRAGTRPVSHPGVLSQLAHMAVPQTFGEQGPAIAAGIPAVTIANRHDGPPVSLPLPQPDRIALVGNAAMALLGTLDQVDAVTPPARALILSGRELSAAMLRVVILLLALPLLVAAVDALARLRRAGVRLRPGLRALMWRAAPLVGGVLALHLLGIGGLLPPAAAGAPPLPSEVPLDARGGLALGVAALIAAGLWWTVRSRAAAAGAAPAGEAAAGLVALAAVLLVGWLLRPTGLLLLLPAAHAMLVATAVPRRWQVGALAAVSLLPFLAIAVSIGNQLNRDPLYGGWYLAATAAEGSRGVLGPMLGVAAIACIWSMAVLVLLRARKGLVAARPPVRRRPPRTPRP